ncbi:hypothetical protein E2562_031171 [Oryza meyeriana var. granulata]|uniref:Uncharacterized protein n=1 Tax=Oryza meyeriana var. granulata TaxID=110450 RepID=A0A6G1EBW8_9ORYZ|nr:hypothetical protein E2562_031171 [Oryza meyeriana var. granulata]
MSNIWKDNKIFNSVKRCISSSKLQRLSWVLLTPTYQNRTQQNQKQIHEARSERATIMETSCRCSIWCTEHGYLKRCMEISANSCT